MKIIITILSLWIIFSNGYAQQPTDNNWIYEPVGNDSVRVVIEQESTFPGGTQGWIKYLQKTLNADLGAKYIKVPKGVTTAKQTVTVQFTVDKDGSLFGFDVVNKNEVHPKLADEAMKVLEKGPKWLPAMQSASLYLLKDQKLSPQQKEYLLSTYKLVKSMKRQAITWVVNVE